MFTLSYFYETQRWYEEKIGKLKRICEYVLLTNDGYGFSCFLLLLEAGFVQLMVFGIVDCGSIKF